MTLNNQEKFDPANPEHRAVYRTYLQTGKLTQKFDPEFPRHTNVVDMMKSKLAAYAVEPRVSEAADAVAAILA